MHDVITPVSPRLYTLQEAAVLLGIRAKTARRMIAEDRFPVPAMKVGVRWYVRRNQLDAFIEGA